MLNTRGSALAPAKAVLVLWIGSGLVGCGSGKGPSTPTAPPDLTTAPSVVALVAPQGVTLKSQTVRLAGDTLTVSWTYPASSVGLSWRVKIGSTPEQEDILVADIGTTTYAWSNAHPGDYFLRVAAVRGTESGPTSSSLPVTAVDLREVIDALLWWSGPYSDGLQNSWRLAAWRDGTNLQVLVSPDVSEAQRTVARNFISTYASDWSSSITGQVVPTSENLLGTGLVDLSAGTIGVRISPDMVRYCGSATAAGCASVGPEPQGNNRSLVTIAQAQNFIAVAHEIGHAYGFGHVNFPVHAGVYGLSSPTMSNDCPSSVLTDYEQEALRVTRAAGVRFGASRSEAVSAGIVPPTVRPKPPENRPAQACIPQ